MAVSALVVSVEGDANAGGVGEPRNRHLDVMALSGIAHLRVALEEHLAGAEIANERSARLFFHLAEGVL